MTTFRDWFKDHLSESASDIVSHGADAGYPDISYTVDCMKIFDQFADEIWEMAVRDAEEMGHKNVCEMIASFKRSDMLETWDQFRNLLLWYACEKVAQEMENDDSL